MSTQPIRFVWSGTKVYVFINNKHVFAGDTLMPNWFAYPGYQTMEKLAYNDGFESVEAFFNYFCKDFKGKIIHWTNLRYYDKKNQTFFSDASH